MFTKPKIELINNKKFAKTALDKNVEPFIVHIASLISKMTIHPVHKTQIALFITKEANILSEYANSVNMFLKKSVKILSK